MLLERFEQGSQAQPDADPHLQACFAGALSQLALQLAAPDLPAGVDERLLPYTQRLLQQVDRVLKCSKHLPVHASVGIAEKLNARLEGLQGAAAAEQPRVLQLQQVMDAFVAAGREASRHVRGQLSTLRQLWKELCGEAWLQQWLPKHLQPEGFVPPDLEADMSAVLEQLSMDSLPALDEDWMGQQLPCLITWAVIVALAACSNRAEGHERGQEGMLNANARGSFTVDPIDLEEVVKVRSSYMQLQWKLPDCWTGTPQYWCCCVSCQPGEGSHSALVLLLLL